METLRKIEELIEQNRTLERRNEELKNIIDANLNQTNETAGYSFSDLIDLSDAKTLIVKFYQHNKAPIALFSDKGKLLFSVGWKNVSALFFQSDEYMYENYVRLSSAIASSVHQKPYRLFQQGNGINTICFPVEIRNKPVATIVVSQFFCGEKMPDISSIEEQAIALRLNWDECLSAFNEIPVITAVELNSIIQNASFLSEMISFLWQKNIEYHNRQRKQAENDTLLSSLREKISEQEMIIKSLILNIGNHQKEVRENTISKTAFVKQQKRLVDRMERSENILNSLLTSLPLGIGFVRHNIFTYANDQIFRITGYTPKELIGRNPELLFNSKGDFKRIMDDNPENFLFKDKKTIEALLVRKDKILIDVVIFVSQIDSNDPNKGLAFSIMDISGIKEAQRQLILAKDKAEESNRLKSAFLNNMSHEFRTPMNAILGFAELLAAQGVNNAQKNEYLKIIQNSCRKLQQLIDDIIDTSKLSSKQLHLNKRYFSIHQLLLELHGVFSDYVTVKHGNAVELMIVEPDERNLDTLFNDDSRLKQVFSNLLSNSLKFTPHGSIEFGYEIKKGYIQFFVRDTGIGISKKQLKYIFDRFRQGDDSSTREHGGAGLGLSLAKGLVELMGGKIWVRPQSGQGTTFYFILPSNNPGSVIDPLNQHDWSNKTILIAEDEELNFQFLQTLLSPTKVNIKWVDNGKKAIDCLEQDPDIDLVLMDIRMPVLNGVEATHAIRRKNKSIPIIAQTAYAHANEREYYIKAGCDEFIPKPVNSSHIISVLARFLAPAKP